MKKIDLSQVLLTVVILIVTTIFLSSCSATQASEPAVNKYKDCTLFENFSYDGYAKTRVRKWVDSTETIVKFDSVVISDYTGDTLAHTHYELR